jgi:choline dehydrogenase-like flavoprotein
VIVSANTLKDRETLTADVVVVGSGCGGGVVAAECAKAGRRVVVLEEGRHVPRSEYARFPTSEALRVLYRDYGAIPAFGRGDSPLVLVIVGRAVGGSSLINGAVCGRTPDWVLDGWVKDFGLTDYTPNRMGPVFDEIEREMMVAETPEELINPATRRFREAANRLGYEGYRIRRNVQDCDGCCRCTFTCPHDHKKSVVITHLDVARRLGATIVSDCQARKLVTRSGRVSGVQGVSADGRIRVRVAAPNVVLSGGSLFTPIFLKKNRLGRASHVGRHLTVHPSVRTYALFDEPVTGWKGAFQSYAIDQFRNEGIRLVNVMIPKALMAGSLPRHGKELRELVERYDHIGLFGGMVSDESSGDVGHLGWRPLVRYDMIPRDRAKVLRTLELLCQIWFEAGARRVFLPFHLPEAAEAASMDEVKRILSSGISFRFLECTAQHPLGTCRMGADPRESVVGPGGSFHGLPGLYVVDGSVVPSSVAVNPQVTIMAIAKVMGQRIAERRALVP